ncbi:hypothetical protein RclHR1_00070024 [Rhizophagus clarus]|uniref:Uncharacterized protein n=1 Tax=Rhizophagus clarus TaxID=94130 RepID=A0A2Z6SJZ0_9GLOM|nr:hypothetical protein RclHR1_00070024 [Rhizophagus clarus]GES78196.1 hypothetical protein GLOIN_2v1476231 [Rhizophagus clarus]
MSEPLAKIKILLDGYNPSESLHFVVLDNETRRYMSVKMSSAEEHIERGNKRNYRSPLKNSYMLFRNDIIDAWNLAKETKKFRKYPESFKDISLLWNNLPIQEEKFEEFIDYSEALVSRSEELQIASVNYDNLTNSVEKNEAISDLSSDGYVPVQLSETYTSAMQYNLHNLNSEIELEMYLNSLLDTGNNNTEEFPTFF